MKFKKITVAEIRVLKSGSNKQGSWTLWLIKDSEGNEYTTFNNIYSVCNVYTIKYTEEVEGTFLQRRIVAPKSSSKEGKLERLEVRVTDLEKTVELLRETMEHHIEHSAPHG